MDRKTLAASLLTAVVAFSGALRDTHASSANATETFPAMPVAPPSPRVAYPPPPSRLQPLPAQATDFEQPPYRQPGRMEPPSWQRGMLGAGISFLLIGTALTVGGLAPLGMKSLSYTDRLAFATLLPEAAIPLFLLPGLIMTAVGGSAMAKLSRAENERLRRPTLATRLRLNAAPQFSATSVALGLSGRF